MSLESMSLEDLIFNIEVLADREGFKGYESRDFTTERACYYREALLREAIRRLKG